LDGDGGTRLLGNGDFGPHLAVQLPQDTPIELLEVKARGRFGAVWKGKMANDNENKFVAVKIFPLQDKSSWIAEKEIYNLAQMNNHENVLKFLGVDKRFEKFDQEFWLATEFHERGSLCDFLKANVVSWEDMCQIALSIAKGLTFLHEEIPAVAGKYGMKPAIAHRDFKSKNVLIKSDMTACIADFGLALVFQPGKSCGDTHGQVIIYLTDSVSHGTCSRSSD
jgi:serine/threonine protein kinase